MHDELAKLHIETYNAVADEYEERVETLRPVTVNAFSDLTALLPIGSRMLDIGCGVGYTVEILTNLGMNAEGIDIAPAMIAYARKRSPESNFTVGDFLDVDYPTQTYDAVLLWAFIHLFPKDTALAIFKKAINILKPGGYILIGTTKSDIAREGFEEKKDYANHVKRYRRHWTPQDLELVIEELGLTIISTKDRTDEFGKLWMNYIVQRPNTAD